MSYLLKKRIFCVVFLLFLLGFSALNFGNAFPELKKTFEKGDVTPTGLSEVMTEEIYERMKLVETYSLVQTAMGKMEFSDFSIIKDQDDYLHYSSFYRKRNEHLFEYAHRVLRLSKKVSESGTKVMFVATPSKYLDGEVKLELGLQGNDPYDNVQELLLYLHRLGIHTLDLSQIFSDSDAPYLSHFYKTDHHWNTAAAFKAMQLLVWDIRDTFGDDLDPDGFYTDLNHYETTLYEDRMLGSMGRQTGIIFSGVEDFELFTPKFENTYSRTSRNNEAVHEYEGNFSEALLKTSLLAEDHDIYRESLYDIYLDGINDYDHIENRSMETGEGKKILFINDSYFSPVIAFMAPMCSSIDRVYNLSTEESQSVEQLIAENQYDYIIIEVYPYNLDQEAFNYFRRNN